MLKRHQVQVLRRAGHQLKQIAKRAGVSERSARRIAREGPVEAVDDQAARVARRVGRPSTVEAFRKSVEDILSRDGDVATVEIVRLVRGQGYEGGKSALYDLVRSLRKVDAKPIVRFEGVAGEFSQHDFGEVHVTYVSGKSEKVVFFASRLKYSRFAHVEVVGDQRVEALVRGLIRSFEVFGGVPLVSVFDNPKTVVLFRQDRVIEWNATFGQAALDLRFAPELCWPRRANQKGAVENLVGWVKSSFFKVRRFHDRADLEGQLREWLHETNHTRPSRATGVIPAERLEDEQGRLRAVPFKADQYALRFPIVVGPTGLVEFEGYRYSMPPRAIGIPGTLFLFPETVRFRDPPRGGTDGAPRRHGSRDLEAALRRGARRRDRRGGRGVTTDLDALLRRLHLPTVRRLYKELEDRAEKEGMSYRDYLGTLIAEEVAHRAQTRIERATRRARFPFLATIEEFDFTFQSSIRLALLGSFLGPELVSEGRSAILLGPSGTGKTHLAIAIGYRAIQSGFETLFTDADHLLEKLSAASQQGGLREVLAEYLHPHVLIIDEVGYLTHRPDAANVLFHVVNERHLRRKPTLFTTNKPLASWGRLLHDPDLAEAILDRVLERGRLIELNGRSYRTRHVDQLQNEALGGRKEAARISGKQRPNLLEPTTSSLKCELAACYSTRSSERAGRRSMIGSET